MDSRPKIERATTEDARRISVVLRRTFESDLPFLPNLHTAEEDFEFIRDKVMPECTVLVAKVDGEIVGFAAYHTGWLNHLYILHEHQGKGIGTTLLSMAKAENEELQLWAFQKNEPARRFYESHGFRAIEFTDGEGNEEKEPDVRYFWKKD